MEKWERGQHVLTIAKECAYRYSCQQVTRKQRARAMDEIVDDAPYFVIFDGTIVGLVSGKSIRQMIANGSEATFRRVPGNGK